MPRPEKNNVKELHRGLKKCHFDFCLYLRQLLIDFQNSFTGTLAYDVVECIIIVSWQIVCRMCQWKNFENRSIIGDDMDESKVASFLTHPVKIND